MLHFLVHLLEFSDYLFIYMSILIQMNSDGQGLTTSLDLFLKLMLDAALKWNDPGCFLCLASRATGMCSYTSASHVLS